jgi:hypothetical protein
MPTRGLRAAALLGLVLATAGVAAGGDEPQWPAWLVGHWEATTEAGPHHITFEPDGTFELGSTSEDGKAVTDPGGRWEVRDGALIAGDPSKGEQTVAFKLERLADEGGQLRMRFAEPGQEATAIVFRKSLLRPRWLIGTWATQGPKGAERLVLRADGQVRHATEVGNDVTYEEKGRWTEKAGSLQLGPISGPPLEIEILPPEEGRVRVRFRDRRPVDQQLVWTRASWLPKPSYEGPLVGRWDVVDAALPTAWFFGIYGRYERRRAFGAGAIVERGVFHVALGGNGQRLHLESDAGHRRVLDLRVEGTTLWMTGAPPEPSVAAQRVEGSHDLVAVDVIEEAAARADTEATYRFLNGDRQRIGAPAPPPSPPAAPDTPEPPTAPRPPATADPAPHDVFAGMEAFRRLQTYRFESLQVLVRDAASRQAVLAETRDVLARAVSGSARPRVVIVLSFQPNGRFTEATDAWALNGTGDPVTVVRHGKYGLQGDVVVMQFDGAPEARWRLGEAGRYVYRGDATWMAAPAWGNMALDGPILPW